MNYQLYYDATQPGVIAGVKCFEPDGSCVCIAIDPDSPSYQQYLQWVAEGNTASTESPPPPPPTTAEKVDQMLTDYDLTRDELRAAFSVTQEVPES